MELKKISQLFIFLVAVLALTLPGMAAEAESIYGHVSFVENQAAVIHMDQAENKAVVNLPLVPGDTIATGIDGRCELQFDNGTVIRLDKNSRLRITTVQAPTLTSRLKITTLHLLQGQMYALPQTYGKEMFQVITPNAAVKLESRTAATIRFDADLSTALFSDAGKFEVLYGADDKALKKVKVKAGQAYIINAANTLAVSTEKRNLEFVAWNEYVDRHFKELHYGISKVPPKLKFGSSALQYWAEKWSSLFGEWIYDELFGYVWKPAGDQFAYAERPFFNAELVRINSQLFLVPQEAWGWVPAHMGTWVWLKTGWTWIPGSWFNPGVTGIFARNSFFDFNFSNCFWYVYGGSDLYSIYREQGNEAWQEHYYLKFHKHYRKPPLKDLPRELQKIVKRINKAPLSVFSERLIASGALPDLEAKKIPLPVVAPKSGLPDKGTIGVSPAAGSKVIANALAPVLTLAPKSKTDSGGELKNPVRRDWNPDFSWAADHGYSIDYSSSRNAVVCPELNISSDRERLLPQDNSVGLVRSMQGYNSGISSQPASASPTTTNGTTATDDQSAKKDDSGK
jgi:hypothetical protein